MAGMSNLRLVPAVGGPIEIAGDRTLLGRDPGADLVVNDPSVSRRHALIERRPEGWLVLDQRSANGTFVNNQRVDQAFLQPGQQLRLGAVSFEVRLPGVSVGAAPPVVAAPPVAPQPPPAMAPPAYAPAAPAYAAPAPAYAPPAPPPAPVMPTPQPGPLMGGPAAPSFVPLTPAAPRAPGPPPPAASAQAGGMSPAEAAELIGLWPGSPPDEVRKRYQKLYNDFQIRLTNAPTPALKKMYQRNMQDLKMACEVISPGAIA
jgi:predicted component of type VI protein secretion system